MSRNFEQIIRSKETDSWKRTLHLNFGTATGGTVTMNVNVSSGREQIFVTGLSFISSLDDAHLHLSHGTSIIYHAYLYSGIFFNNGGIFKDSFETPLKIPAGTALEIRTMGLLGTHCVNVNGYTVK